MPDTILPKGDVLKDDPNFPQVDAIAQFGPRDLGWQAWTIDPVMTNGQLASTNGRIEGGRIKHLGGQVNGISVGCVVQGTALNAGQCFMGIYSDAGVRLAQTADLSGAFGASAVEVDVNLTAPINLGPGYYNIAMLFNNTAGANPSLIRATSNTIVILAGKPAPPFRGWTADTGVVALPANLGARSNAGMIPFFALY